MTCVLLIDDNDDQRAVLADALRERGWVVTTARNGRLGLEIASRIHPSIVITELILPDVRGFHFANALRRLIELDVYIIALTRLPEQLFPRVLQAGFDDAQSKPIDVDQLHHDMSSLNACRLRRVGQG